MKQALLQFIDEHSLLRKQHRVLVALSGGADSTCLLHLLTQVHGQVAAAHLHHGQRPEADADLEHCRAQCEALGIEFFTGRADVPAYAAAAKVGLEEAGRNLRYEFLHRIATQAGFDKVATGHTRDDLVESMLLNLARGAGMRGAAGMPVSRGKVIRPILFAERCETRDYCASHGLAFVEDPGNDDLAFARNSVRLRVLPLLKEINSECVPHMAQAARILAEEDALLDALAGSHLARAEIPETGALAFLERRFAAAWRPERDLPIALLRRCVRVAASLFDAALDFDATHALALAIQNGEKASYTAEGGEAEVVVAESSWTVRRPQPPKPFRELVTLPGETLADDLGWSLAAWRGETQESPLQGSLDEQKLKGALYLRSIAQGDRISPPGRGESKTLLERLARAGVSSAVRAAIPVVCDMLGPVWAPVVGADRRAAADSRTERPISLRLGDIQPEPGGTPEAV